jgi:hypothetical protein
MIETGLRSKFWEYPFANMQKVVGRTWISTLWEFLDMNSITLRYNDKDRDSVVLVDYIMAKAIQHRVSDISLFNLCRLYLQIERMSELFTADGKSIRRAIWLGQRQAIISQQHEWPRQESPSAKGWKVWQ